MWKLSNLHLGASLLAALACFMIVAVNRSFFSNQYILLMYIVMMAFAIWEVSYIESGVLKRMLNGGVYAFVCVVTFGFIFGVSIKYTASSSLEEGIYSSLAIISYYIGIPVILGVLILCALPVRPLFFRSG